MTICGLTMHREIEKSCLGCQCQMWDEARQDCGLKWPLKLELKTMDDSKPSGVEKEPARRSPTDTVEYGNTQPGPFSIRYDVIDHDVACNLRFFFSDESGSPYTSANPLSVSGGTRLDIMDLIHTFEALNWYYQTGEFPAPVELPLSFPIAGKEHKLIWKEKYNFVLLSFEDKPIVSFTVQILDDKSRKLFIEGLGILAAAKASAFEKSLNERIHKKGYQNISKVGDYGPEA